MKEIVGWCTALGEELMEEFKIEIDEYGNAATTHPDAPLTIDDVRELQEALAHAEAESTCPECGKEVDDLSDHLQVDCWTV